MRTALALVALALVAEPVAAEHVLQEITWPESLPDGVTQNADGSVTITSTENEGRTVALVEVDAPGITQTRYVVKGRVRYAKVAGDAFVEMWSVFPDGRYFTRTNLDQGPMAKITGSSDWRSIVLPFDWTGAPAPPERLEINAVLPGTGEIALGPLTLVELDPNEPLPVSALNPGAAAGLWGGLAGGVFGTIAGLLGWLGSRGKAKAVVLTGFRLLMAGGGVALLLGIVVLARGMPYHVYYPLLLLGAIALIVPASTLPRLTRRYEELELRRMSALDA